MGCWPPQVSNSASDSVRGKPGKDKRQGIGHSLFFTQPALLCGKTGTGTVAGSPLSHINQVQSFSTFVHFVPVTDTNNKNPYFFLMDITEDAIRTNPVAPVFPELPMQRLPNFPGGFKLGYSVIKKSENSFSFAFFNFLQIP